MAGSDDGDPLFVVTTRSRLRGARYFPSMMRATLAVRRQLIETPGVVRWASVVAGPTEFWTVTVWRTRHDMQEFMRSGAHEAIMWTFSRWIESFWQMRWQPGPVELGDWKGLSLAYPDFTETPSPPSTSNDALQQALRYLPKLKAATDTEGRARRDKTPFARRRRAEVGDAGGVVVHVRTSLWKTPAAFRALAGLRRQARADEGCLRVVLGVSRPGELYLFAVWRDRAGAAAVLASPALAEIARRWPAGHWAQEWIPESEFGHWDGLRLRRVRHRYGIAMPAAARAAVRHPGDNPASEGAAPDDLSDDGPSEAGAEIPTGDSAALAGSDGTRTQPDVEEVAEESCPPALRFARAPDAPVRPPALHRPEWRGTATPEERRRT